MRNPQAVVGAMLVLLFSLALPRPAWAANEPQSEPEVNVGIVLFDGVQIIDFAGPYEVFGAAGFGVVTLTRDGKPITTTMGLKVTPDHDFANAPDFDILLVPGGTTADAQKDPATLDFIRSRAAGVDHLLSVCTGSFVLAATGLLDGLQATTFTPRIDQLSREFPEVDVIRDVRWADSGKIITSAGLSSGMDAALHVVARMRGTEVARSTALHLEYDWQPEGGFIRSLMADRYMPGLRDVVWPENTKFDRSISVGDEQTWRMHFDVTSPAGQDVLMELIANGVQSTGDWTRKGGTDAYRWEGELENRHVVLEFKATPSDTEEHFELEVMIDADEPTS
ncbi:MAG: DJ-1/PfpI family protein [Lysobacter sp.]